MKIYNVKVLGNSIGLTFDKEEAERWKKESRVGAVIEVRNYKQPEKTDD